jgi:hypothetical protein
MVVLVVLVVLLSLEGILCLEGFEVVLLDDEVLGGVEEVSFVGGVSVLVF